MLGLRFAKAVTRLINLIDSEVGRPIERISDNLDVEDLSEKSADNIAVDLGEGYEAVFILRKQAVRLLYYAHFSLFDTGTGLRKARNRRIVDREQFASLNEEDDTTAMLLYGYIKSIGNKNNH